MEFNGVADANYYHDNMWYRDPKLKHEATDNRYAFERAMLSGKMLTIPQGNYYMKPLQHRREMIKVPATYKSVALVGEGVVNIYVSAWEGKEGKQNLRVFSIDADEVFIDNINVQSVSLFTPWNNNEPQVGGYGSNIVAWHTEAGGGFHFNRCDGFHLSSFFSKSNFKRMGTNYNFIDCKMENNMNSVFLQYVKNVNFTRCRMTTNNTALNGHFHASYLGANCNHVRYTDCYLEVKNENTGDVAKFAFDPKEFPNDAIRDVAFTNCTLKTKGTEITELTGVEGITFNDCQIIIENEKKAQKICVLTAKPSKDVVFQNCKMQALYMAQSAENIGGEWTSNKHPVQFMQCRFYMDGDNITGVFPSFINDKAHQYFMGCIFMARGTETVVFVRDSKHGGKKVSLDTCTFDSKLPENKFFSLAHKSHFEVYNCKFGSSTVKDVIPNYNDKSVFISVKNIYVNARQLNSKFKGVSVDDSFVIESEGKHG